MNKIDVKSEENEVFYTSKNKNYRQHSYRRSFNRNNQNFKNKNYNKKTNPRNNKGEISKFQLLWVKISLGKNCPDAIEKYNLDLLTI